MQVDGRLPTDQRYGDVMNSNEHYFRLWNLALPQDSHSFRDQLVICGLYRLTASKNGFLRRIMRPIKESRSTGIIFVYDFSVPQWNVSSWPKY
jgi:hypothetical protein